MFYAQSQQIMTATEVAMIPNYLNITRITTNKNFLFYRQEMIHAISISRSIRILLQPQILTTVCTLVKHCRLNRAVNMVNGVWTWSH